MQETISIKEIYKKIAQNRHQDIEDIENIGNLLFGYILQEIKNGDRVRISNFGSFSLKKCKSKICILDNLKDKPVEEYVKITFEPVSSVKKNCTEEYREGSAKAFK